KPGLFKESIILTIAPDAGTALEKTLIDHVKGGGKIIIYGPTDHSSEDFLNFLNLTNSNPLEGEFSIVNTFSVDDIASSNPEVVRHNSLSSAGGIRTLIKDTHDEFSKLLLSMQRDGAIRHSIWS